MSDFSYRTVNRRFSVIFPNIRSLFPRFLYSSWSYAISSFRFLLPGITGVLLFPSNVRRNSVPSYPRSPYRTSSYSFNQFIRHCRIMYLPPAQHPFHKFPVNPYYRMKLRAYPRTAVPFCLPSPFCPPPCRWTFIVVRSIITSLNTIPSSWRFARIFPVKPQLKCPVFYHN